MDTVLKTPALFGSAENIKRFLMPRHSLTHKEAATAMAAARRHSPATVEDPELGIKLRWCETCKGYNYGG
jgi:hypothetical protein